MMQIYAGIHDLPEEILESVITAAGSSSRLMMSMTSKSMHHLFYCDSDNIDAFCNAFLQGHIAVIEFMCNLHYPAGRLGCEIFAGMGGHIESVKWLQSHGLLNGKVAARAAARAGQIHILKYLRENSYANMSKSVLASAVEGGSIDTCEWVWNEGHPFRAYEIYVAAISEGNLEMVEWVHSKFECGLAGDNFCSLAAIYGYLDIFEWLIDNGATFDVRSILDDAVRSKNIKLIKYVHELGGIPTPNTAGVAIQNGDYDTLRWLMEIGCPPCEDACHLAGIANSPEILRLLGESGHCTCKRYHSRDNGHTSLVNRVSARVSRSAKNKRG